MRVWLTAAVSVAAIVVALGYLHPFGNPRNEPPNGLSTLWQDSSMPANARQVLCRNARIAIRVKRDASVFADRVGLMADRADIIEARKHMDPSHLRARHTQRFW